MKQPHEFIPVRLNVAIAAALLALNLVQVAAVPLLLPFSPWWGLLLVLPVATSPTLWAMIHEGVHGHLHPSRAWNDRLSRALSVAFGSPFQLLRFGHLMHHRFNRSALNRIEVVETAPEPTLRERAAYYFRLFFGLYLSELAASVLAIMPDTFWRPLLHVAFGDEAPDGRTMWEGARRQLLEEPGRSRMRLDGAIATAVIAASFMLYGSFWWLLALALLGRAFLISFFDNAYHYAGPLDDPMSAHDLRLPEPVRGLFLNFNYHASHHRRPSVPWPALPEVQVEIGERFAGAFLPAALRQLEGPIPEQRFAEDVADLLPREAAAR